MADEIPKPLKIIWLLNIIPCILWAIFYIFLLEDIIGVGLFTQFSPSAAGTGRSLGMLMVVFAIFLIRMYFLDDWAKIQFYVEFALCWIIGAIIVNLWSIIGLNLSPTGMALQIVGTIILIVLEVAYIYYYLQLKE